MSFGVKSKDFDNKTTALYLWRMFAYMKGFIIKITSLSVYANTLYSNTSWRGMSRSVIFKNEYITLSLAVF